MRRTALFCSFALVMSMSATAADTKVTLYSGDFDSVSNSYPSAGMPGLALVSQQRSFELPRGAGSAALDQLPTAIDIGSVRLQPANPALRITGQRYDFALPDQSALLNQAIGQRVQVEQADGGTRRSHSGILLAAGNGLTLLRDDGKVTVLASYSSFELASLPEGMSSRPTLRWELDSPRAGRETFQLDYATGGMAWQAEYLARVDGPAQRCTLSFSGAAQVINRSGASFPATALTLVAGNPNQVRSSAPRAPAPVMAKAAAMMDMAYESAPDAEASGEYHAYPLRQRIDLPNGSIQRVSLLDPTEGVACERRYEVGNSGSSWRPPRPQVHSNPNPEQHSVTTTLNFTNDEKSGLGKPLPAGRVRVFEAGSGADALLGEAHLGHTATGQKVALALGEAFDLSAERTQTELRLAADRLSLEETIQVKLSNAKSSAVTVRVHEALNRWQDWEILESSQDWERNNAQNVRFDVNVPANGETVLSYRVRYRWPADVRP